jgi:hypothetical protein
MRVGVDFDNTIVCYDTIFHSVAVERKLIPDSVSPGKGSVRDYLRQADRENDWTELQGYIYGPGLEKASPYPGVLKFFKQCRALAVDVFIVSHKTRHPFKGPQYNLHDSARKWLKQRQFHDIAGVGLPESRVYLEQTKEKKIARIAKLHCDYFIDDLPEFLQESTFPPAVQRVLFDPHKRAKALSGIEHAASWDEILAAVLPSTAA